ncbi:hypothetical protein KORDIASMS9_04269 [Kordia sp. SMS9]|uniref:T9SS type A sorting domain-containing protein n=1 Tax=Kordia sp. SMS9 TaxID=2282170 RepID=UPI000E0D319E|nr:T9SS type A sorting domain-containing protein [Kordia sp. SMS9]AXG72007.1 hypothetical protein KORDIASMS9_04269 [Kordia sp. SMS9]
MKKLYILLLAVFASHTTQAQDDPNLLGQWFLHYIESNGTIMYPPSDGANPSIIFSNLTPNPFDFNGDGSGVCNSFFLHYELPNSTTITISEFSSTLVFCNTNAQDAYEFMYFSILNNNPTSTFDYTIDLPNETLTMIDLLGEKLVYGRQILSTKDNEVFSNNIKVYPNPAQKEIFMTGIAANSKTSYSIYNLVGNVAVSERSMTQASLDVSQLKAGVYFIKIQQQGKTAVKKFVKI